MNKALKLIKSASQWLRKTIAAIRGETILMANTWPATSGSGGYLAHGRTTIRWGSDGIVQSVKGSTKVGYFTVLRANEKELVDRIPLSNGVGQTSTRILIIDGAQWVLTIRDDTSMTPPTAGDQCVVVDMAGILGAVGLTWRVTVVDNGYSAAPKTAGEREMTVERLELVEPNISGSDVAGGSQI